MEKHIVEEIEKLQDNLAVIRKAGNWTCEQFGDLLGLSKQSICNLEHKTVKMSKPQYIAIRSILDYTIEENDLDGILDLTVKIFMNSHDIPNEVMMKARTFYNGLSKNEMNYRYIVLSMCTIIGESTFERLIHKPVDHWMNSIMKKSEER